MPEPTLESAYDRVEPEEIVGFAPMRGKVPVALVSRKMLYAVAPETWVHDRLICVVPPGIAVSPVGVPGGVDPDG